MKWEEQKLTKGCRYRYNFNNLSLWIDSTDSPNKWIIGLTDDFKLVRRDNITLRGKSGLEGAKKFAIVVMSSYIKSKINYYTDLKSELDSIIKGE